MKRSEINQVIRDMENLIRERGFCLPPFANWEAEDWKDRGKEFDEIRDNQLGWDITDYGLGRFHEVGFGLLTIRNGNTKNAKAYPKTYAEKLLMLYEGQSSPLHFHAAKMEDIINRGGNDVYITVYNGTPDKEKLDTDVTVHRDGKCEVVPAGTSICLTPGESITITPFLFHDFKVPKEGGPVLLGEVSMCNDDERDNFFYEEIGRFPQIEEDELPYRLLCNEYPKADA
ncbi:D-lyxose/D-mannose family sugar isomerase [Clostridiaceae bacterium 68-1-5]|uniref:D-lyxose ketol-isomerase n=1 Tax=Suipraeoptans intestinalis TaxID=2606628 RepID=A0A6N7V2Q3_9FIRM|nr:D-lyxose/D-mannose family sugar isomerase [Suipraeoptans intestinalis]MSR94166.1 D-lyxose/D-mannose family sugar isomerase [Suipraeoptans intestinalis]